MSLRAHLLAAHLHHLLVARIGLHRLRPAVEQLLATPASQLSALPAAHPARADALPSIAARRFELLPLARDARLLLGVLVVAAHRLGDLGEVALALRRHHDVHRGGDLARRLRQLVRPGKPSFVGHGVVERGDAVVVEARGDGAEHRHVLGRVAERLAVALHLLAHVAQRVLGAAAVELVDRDEVGEVEHVDLLELAGGAELRRHHVERGVDVRHDRRVALADARGLDDHQVEARGLASRDRIADRGGQLAAGVARGERAHEDARPVDRVHADAVAEQRAAGLAARRDRPRASRSSARRSGRAGSGAPARR